MLNYGKKSLRDALENNLDIKNIYLTNKNVSFIKTFNINNAKVNIVDESFFSNVKSINHQFIAYEIEKKNINLNDLLIYLKELETSIVLIVDSIEDPRNFGSILRSCDAFKIDAVFYKKHNQSPINDLVVTISKGATNYLNTCEVSNLNNLIENLKKLNFWIYSTTLSNNSIPYYKEKYPSKICIVVGNENTGISNLVVKNSDVLIHIPMLGKVQSLNVSVATGIILSYIRMKNN